MILILNKFALEYYLFVIISILTQKLFVQCVLKSYRLCIIAWAVLYHSFEGPVFLFLSLLKAQILKIIITSSEISLARDFQGEFDPIFMKTFDLCGSGTHGHIKLKNQTFPFTHCNCSLLKSFGSSVVLRFCHRQVLSLSTR